MTNLVSGLLDPLGTGGATLSAKLQKRSVLEGNRASILKFTIYEDAAGDIIRKEWGGSETNYGATSSALTTALQAAIDGLTTNRTSYETVRVAVNGGTITSKIVISEDWTDIVLEGPLTAVIGLNDYMFYGEGVEHVRIWGGDLNHDYINQSAGGGFQFERCNWLYFHNVTSDNAYQEAFETKTCANVFFESCSGDSFGDDAFSILDSNNVLVRDCVASGAREATGGSSSFEFEDGSTYCVLTGCRTLNGTGNGMSVIVDSNVTRTITNITEIGAGIYRFTTSTSVSSLSTGKDIKLTGGGVYDGTWNITDVDFTGGTWFEADLGTAGYGNDATPTTDTAEFTHGSGHDIYIYDHYIDGMSGGGINITSNATNLSDGLPQKQNRIFVDGVDYVNGSGSAVQAFNATNCELRRVIGVGDGTTNEEGMSFNQCRYFTVVDCDMRHFGSHGYWAFRSLDITFLNCKAHDNSEVNTFAFGFALDPNLYDWDTDTLTAANDQAGGFSITNCDSWKLAWNPTGGNFRGGIRIDDCSGTTVTDCTFHSYSASVDIRFEGGATSGNSNIGNYVTYEQP